MKLFVCIYDDCPYGRFAWETFGGKVVGKVVAPSDASYCSGHVMQRDLRPE